MDVQDGLLWLFLLGVLPGLPIAIFLKYLYVRRTQPTMSAHGDTLRSHSDQIRQAIAEGIEAVVFCTCLVLLIVTEAAAQANLIQAAVICFGVGAVVISAFHYARLPLDRLLRRWIP